MSTQPERPGRRRRPPQPAPDDKLDPVDYRTQPPAIPAAVKPPTSQAPPAPRGRKEATVQLATRISLEVDAILTQAVATTGQSKRALVEEAIRKTWA